MSNPTFSDSVLVGTLVVTNVELGIDGELVGYAAECQSPPIAVRGLCVAGALKVDDELLLVLDPAPTGEPIHLVTPDPAPPGAELRQEPTP